MHGTESRDTVRVKHLVTEHDTEIKLTVVRVYVVWESPRFKLYTQRRTYSNREFALLRKYERNTLL